jgi:tRNA(Arg) A34 adenosine deaminase TadA
MLMTVKLSAQDTERLKRAIDLADAAVARGNRPFGAVLFGASGELLAETSNSVRSDADPTAHAEVNALRAAARQSGLECLADSSLYASGEPCAMCASAMFWAGVSRITYGLSEDKYRSYMTQSGILQLGTSCREVLRNAERAIEIIGPALEDEAILPLERFHKANAR